MTLRGRLTMAFLAVVLGPVLLGSFFVGMTVAAVSRDRTADRLDHAVAAVRTAIGATCRQLQAVADAVAMVPAGERRAAADQMAARGLATEVRLGEPDRSAERECTMPSVDSAAVEPSEISAVVARAERGDVVVIAVERVDAAWARRLGDIGGAVVEVGLRAEVAPASSGVLPAYGSVERALPAEPGQPLPLVVSVESSEPTALYLVLLLSVGAVVCLAVLAARWLARSTTQPLAELAWAVGRVADGDLDVRVPVGRDDEIGKLAGAFNRMTHELQGYVQALTASRDQLRGHLAILGDTLSSTHDLHRILQVILQTALSATGARAGVVLLTEAEGYLVARYAEGLPGRWDVSDADLPSLRVPLGLGILGSVAASGEPERGFCPVGGGVVDEPACRTYVAVPICAPATVGDPLVPREAPPTVAPGGPLGEPASGAPTGITGGTPGGVTGGTPDGVTGGIPDGVTGGIPGGGPGGIPGGVPRQGGAAAGSAGGVAGGQARRGGRPAPGEPLLAGDRMARPAAGRPRILGVLALYDRLGGDEFDDADLLTLRTFSGQAGVAVHNVRVHEEAQRLSLTDPLTGLWNYRYLRESLRREVERASRFARTLTVMVLDLDHFKDVNDTYGHAAGDTVLAEFARRLRAGLREVDVAFRQGGEEFVVLLPETDAFGGSIVAERIGAAVRDVPVRIEPRTLGGTVVDEVTVSVSIGIAIYPEHGATAQQVLDAADDALYAAKKSGRDTYRLAEAIPLPEVSRSQRPARNEKGAIPEPERVQGPTGTGPLRGQEPTAKGAVRNRGPAATGNARSLERDNQPGRSAKAHPTGNPPTADLRAASGPPFGGTSGGSTPGGVDAAGGSGGDAGVSTAPLTSSSFPSEDPGVTEPSVSSVGEDGQRDPQGPVAGAPGGPQPPWQARGR